MKLKTYALCTKHLKAPDMLIQCILVYIILYFNILHQYKIGNYIFLKNSKYNELNYYYIIFTDTRICVNDSLNPLQ